MQNSSTGMLDANVPVAVVPSAPRWPSWKIQTSAPNAAVSERTLSTTAFTGSTTLPVSRNSSPSVMTAMAASTHGSRSVTACTLSWLICATPASCTVRPSGPLTACTASSCACDASENSGALLPMVRKALPSTIAAPGPAGPTFRPPTKVPVGAVTSVTAATRERSAA